MKCFPLNSFNNMKKNALENLSIFRFTYVRGQLFPNMNYIKNRYRARLTDDSLQSCVEYGQLLRAITSFYCRPDVCVRANGKQSKPFHVGVGLWQGCVLSPLLFIVYMKWIDKCSQADECATIGNCKISRLLFADDLVLLSSSESGLQRTLHTVALQTHATPRNKNKHNQN